jgi:pimeloyl-ACP methyl ester carboxylesterase
VDLIDIEGGSIAFDRMGDGPSVVLGHASLVDRRMWREQFDALAHRYDVIAYDRLGYGASSAAPARNRPGVDLLRVLDALDVESAALVGSSMGGGYALDAALLAPDRVTSLVLICAGIPGYEWPDAMLQEARELLRSAVPGERLAQYAAHTADVVRDGDIVAMAEAQARYMVLGPGRGPEAFEPAVWRFVLEMTQHVFARMWRDPVSDEVFPSPALLSRLNEIAVPTLVISGRCDVPYIQELSTQIATCIPHARHLEMPETGHLPPLERSAEINAAMLAFLG